MDQQLIDNAFAETVYPGDDWISLSDGERVDLVRRRLQDFEGAETFKVVKVDASGQVVISTEKNIPANERGMYLLSLERWLKQSIDEGLHLWCEPVGDRSKLRNLRGVVIKS